MNNAEELLEDIQDNINKVPFITMNGRTGVIIRKYHWSIKSQINLIKEALESKIDEDIFILEEYMAEHKYMCIEPTINNISNYSKIKKIVESTLKTEGQRVQEQIEELLLLHK